MVKMTETWTASTDMEVMCNAIASVDRGSAEQIAKRHQCDCDKCISTKSPVSCSQTTKVCGKTLIDYTVAWLHRVLYIRVWNQCVCIYTQFYLQSLVVEKHFCKSIYNSKELWLLIFCIQKEYECILRQYS